MSYQIHIGPNIRKSPYFDATVADGVRSFSVYNHMFIPGNFGDPDAEYDRLLNGVAMWDVAAQRQVEMAGPDAGRLAQLLTPRNLNATKVGQGRYVPICDHDGMLINDPVLLKLSEDRYWLSIADSDLVLWAGAIAKERGLDVTVSEPDVSPLAIQGPKAADVTAALIGDWIRDLRYFWFRETELDGIPLVVARSGWSKQGGYELYLMDGSRGSALWDKVKRVGASFGIGPGAPNDIERLESGLISYGADIRRQTLPTDPFEMGFDAMIDLDGSHDFIGKDALKSIRDRGPRRRRVGVVIDGTPISGNEHPLPLMQGTSDQAEQVGIVSEVAHSRRLGKNIGVGLAQVELADTASDLFVDLAEGRRKIVLSTLPFA
ncbi:glycine cleavage system protein T [Rhodospirillaceae bacterium KN72]|uniref:Glycine cleavage system protein T n=1 Tax=Pacificispira spongiicola TaxID=2729598 RepID=A0A7Y0E1F9_9PROT|nr:glycine cleavage T C-terminal barrel domain-containing protein [Pacificispira spongiicola]NMM45499.1 glycine cleavage system protein T [Pacificispira spongiicola]